MDFDLSTHTHLLTVAGSRVYGLHTASSDVDIKGVAVPPARYYHGFLKRFEQADAPSHMAPFTALLNDEERAAVASSKLEGSVYELTKFVRLVADANPNMLDLLFCRDDDVRQCSPIGARLREHRHLFLSARAKHTFSGYAVAQLKRIKGHRRWLLDPPAREPERADFGLPPRTLIPSDQLMAAQAAIQKRLDEWEVDFGELPASQVLYVQEQITRFLAEVQETTDSRFKSAGRAIGYDENFMELLDRERRYKAARNDWEQYQRWKAERNADRAALEAKHGYDTKHAMHLVRLLRMGREILETGQVHVWRGDRDGEELRAIRAGAWDYDRLVGWAEAEDAALEQLYRGRSYAVPRAPDLERIDALVVELVELAIGRSG